MDRIENTIEYYKPEHYAVVINQEFQLIFVQIDLPVKSENK